ncbi:hypothetical protein HK101_001514 [Irineochytrium annulatum]|nr:hypothetical protein HK101_001514 [Irineochytrium annulatum]
MSRYNTPQALSQAVSAARSLPIDRSGDVWRIDVVCKDKFTVASVSNPSGLIRTNLTLPSSNPPTGPLLLDLLLQSCLLPISNQPTLRPRSIALQCTRNPDGLVSDSLFLVPLSCVAELEELMRGCGLSVRIRVSMRQEEAEEERERNRRRQWEERAWASETAAAAAASQHNGGVVYARGVPVYRGGPHGYPVNGRNGSPAKRGGRTVTADGAEWWDGGGMNGSGKEDMEDVSCFRIIVRLLMMLPVVNLLVIKLRLVEGSRSHRSGAMAASGTGKGLRG